MCSHDTITYVVPKLHKSAILLTKEPQRKLNDVLGNLEIRALVVTCCLLPRPSTQTLDSGLMTIGLMD